MKPQEPQKPHVATPVRRGPLPDSEIESVLAIGSTDRMRHCLFARLILGVDWLTALHIGVACQDQPLTVPVARVIADGWIAGSAEAPA